MPDYILRIEGQNFNDTVFNTTDLSTIRGSSLCLEAFGYEVNSALETEAKSGGGEFELLYAAAAQAVFRLKNMSAARAAKFEEQARKILSKSYRQGADEPPYADWATLERWEKLEPDTRLQYLKTPSEHMTFAMTREEIIEEDWRAALNRALWRNRRQQMQQPNLPHQDEATEKLVCPIDPNRNVAEDPETHGAIIPGVEGQFPECYDMGPAFTTKKTNVRQFKASRRSADLRTYGRDARRTVYAVTLGSQSLLELLEQGLFGSFDFSHSFEDIVADPPENLPLSLQGKLAFLYFDGTDFGSIRSETDIKEFSVAVQKIVRHTTKKLLTHYMRNADRNASNTYGLFRSTYRRMGESEFEMDNITRLRLETLMSGGEDLLLAVPAWLAWDIAWRMLAWFREVGIGIVEDVSGKKRDMIFRAGLLICDRKTPARRATAAAHAICQDAKKAPAGGTQPVLGFHIVEGFDVPETSGSWESAIRDERERVFGSGEPNMRKIANGFRLTADHRQAFEEGVRRFKAEFARSQLYRLIGDVDVKYRDSNFNEEDLRSFLHEQLKMHQRRSAAGMDLPNFLDCLPGPQDAGILFRMKLLADVWDYIDPLVEASPARGQP